MHAAAARADRADPEGRKVSDRFGAAASRYSAHAALLLGWSPQTFWSATPEEMGAILGVLRGDGEAGTIDRGTLDKLMEQDRGG